MAQRVLKAGSAAGEAQTTYNFIDLRQRCDDYVARVRGQCRQWVTQAESEAASIRQAAYDEGRKQGLAEGLSDAARQIEKQSMARSDQQIATTLATALPALQQAAAEIAQQRDAWQHRWEQDALSLVLAVAGKLARRSLTVDEAAFRERLAAAIAVAGGEGTLRITLHPDDLAAARSLADEHPQLDFRSDASLARGDCLVQCGEGRVDGRLDEQLAQIERELLR